MSLVTILVPLLAWVAVMVIAANVVVALWELYADEPGSPQVARSPGPGAD